MDIDPDFLRYIKIGVALMALGLTFVIANLAFGKFQDYIKEK